jgi:hypothetical protein
MNMNIYDILPYSEGELPEFSNIESQQTTGVEDSMLFLGAIRHVLRKFGDPNSDKISDYEPFLFPEGIVTVTNLMLSNSIDTDTIFQSAVRIDSLKTVGDPDLGMRSIRLTLQNTTDKNGKVLNIGRNVLLEDWGLTSPRENIFKEMMGLVLDLRRDNVYESMPRIEGTLSEDLRMARLVADTKNLIDNFTDDEISNFAENLQTEPIQCIICPKRTLRDTIRFLIGIYGMEEK